MSTQYCHKRNTRAAATIAGVLWSCPLLRATPPWNTSSGCRRNEVPAAVPAAAVPAAAATAAEAIAAATAAKPAAAAIVIVLGTKHFVAKAAAAAIVKVPKSVSISALWALAEQGASGPKTRPGRSEPLWA